MPTYHVFVDKCFKYYREKIGDYGADNIPAEMIDCECPDQCDELRFRKTVSHANWPVHDVRMKIKLPVKELPKLCPSTL
jgi:hypothetical protein